MPTPGLLFIWTNSTALIFWPILARLSLGVLVRAIRQQTRSKSEVLDLMRAIPTQTTLHMRASLLAEVIRDVEKNA